MTNFIYTGIAFLRDFEQVKNKNENGKNKTGAY
jgi:hypothetical protein